MSYSNPDTMLEIANIISSFEEDNLRELFRDQILEEDMFTSVPINHFQPLYVSMKKALEMIDISADDEYRIKSNFDSICEYIIDVICERYHMTFDEEWKSANYGKIPAVASAMYQFFVLDIFFNTLGVLKNYIGNNIDELAKAFEGLEGFEPPINVADITNSKIADPRYAIIISSINDVNEYTLQLLDHESIFDFMNPGYIPGIIIKQLVDELVLVGDFVMALMCHFKENLTFKAKIGFEMIFQIKNHGKLLIDNMPELLEEEDTSEDLLEVDED